MDGGFINLFDMSKQWRKVGGGDDLLSEIRWCLTPSITGTPVTMVVQRGPILGRRPSHPMRAVLLTWIFAEVRCECMREDPTPLACPCSFQTGIHAQTGLLPL